MIKTRNVANGLYKNYLQKAEEYSQAMTDELEKLRFNSAVLCAIHCGISAADALTVFFKGVRHAGEKHEDVIQLLETLELDRTVLQNKTRQLIHLLQVKNAAEYEERVTTENGALTALKNAERFFDWVKGVLPEET